MEFENLDVTYKGLTDGGRRIAQAIIDDLPLFVYETQLDERWGVEVCYWFDAQVGEGGDERVVPTFRLMPRKGYHDDEGSGPVLRYEGLEDIDPNKFEVSLFMGYIEIWRKHNPDCILELYSEWHDSEL